MTTAPRRTLWRFASAGIANTAIGLAIIYAARAAGIGEVGSNALGYACGLMFSFGLNRRWTFRHRGPLGASAWRFVAVILLAWLANLGVLIGLLDAGVTPAAAQAVAVLPYAVVSYFGCKWWAFGPKGSRA